MVKKSLMFLSLSLLLAQDCFAPKESEPRKFIGSSQQVGGRSASPPTRSRSNSRSRTTSPDAAAGASTSTGATARVRPSAKLQDVGPVALGRIMEFAGPQAFAATSATCRHLRRQYAAHGNPTSPVFNPSFVAGAWKSSFSKCIFDTNIFNKVIYLPDGRCLGITGSTDNNIRIFDVDSGRLLSTLVGHTAAMRLAEISPDGRFVATGALDGTARLWYAETGAPIRTIGVIPVDGEILSLDYFGFSPDSQRLVTAWDSRSGEGATVARIWESATGNLLHRLQGHTGLVTSAKFSPNGQFIVTASRDHTARIWESASGNPVRILREHQDWVTSAEFSPDGQTVATTSEDGTAKIWDLRTDEAPRTLNDASHAASPYSARFSPDGKKVVTGHFSTRVKIWDVATGQLLHQLRINEKRVSRSTSAQFSPDGRFVVTTSVRGTISIWCAATGALVSENRESVMCEEEAQFSPCGKKIAVTTLCNGGDKENMLVRILHFSIPQVTMPVAVSCSARGLVKRTKDGSLPLYPFDLEPNDGISRANGRILKTKGKRGSTEVID